MNRSKWDIDQGTERERHASSNGQKRRQYESQDDWRDIYDSGLFSEHFSREFCESGEGD